MSSFPNLKELPFFSVILKMNFSQTKHPNKIFILIHLLQDVWIPGSRGDIDLGYCLWSFLNIGRDFRDFSGAIFFPSHTRHFQLENPFLIWLQMLKKKWTYVFVPYTLKSLLEPKIKLIWIFDINRSKLVFLKN